MCAQSGGANETLGRNDSSDTVRHHLLDRLLLLLPHSVKDNLSNLPNDKSFPLIQLEKNKKIELVRIVRGWKRSTFLLFNQINDLMLPTFFSLALRRLRNIFALASNTFG